MKLKSNEVHDVFLTLDMHKNGYLTSEEIEFFLNIIGNSLNHSLKQFSGEEVSEQEIQEMIKMLDHEG